MSIANHSAIAMLEPFTNGAGTLLDWLSHPVPVAVALALVYLLAWQRSRDAIAATVVLLYVAAGVAVATTIIGFPIGLALWVKANLLLNGPPAPQRLRDLPPALLRRYRDSSAIFAAAFLLIPFTVMCHRMMGMPEQFTPHSAGSLTLAMWAVLAGTAMLAAVVLMIGAGIALCRCALSAISANERHEPADSAPQETTP